MEEAIDQGVKVFNQGGIVIFPTDTAFGIGCRIDEKEAIVRLLTLRKRPAGQPTSILVSSLHMAGRYVLSVPEDVMTKLITPFWPGALTIILPANTETVPDIIRGNTDTVGLRVPDHLTTLEIINKLDAAILGPSANFHGGKTPFDTAGLDPQLLRLADFIIPGTCHKRYASTVIDCSVIPWKTLRKGAVDI